MTIPSKFAIGVGVPGIVASGYAYYLHRRRPVVVVGGGVMGLQTAECLARAGKRVLLIDANHPIRGSWGTTRASHFRMEDPTLLKMSLFSVKRWLDLQTKYSSFAGDEENSLFYQKTGAAMAGPADAMQNLAINVQKTIGEHPESRLEILSSEEVAQRLPQLRLSRDEKLVYMPDGYTIVVQTCLECLHWAAQRAGVRYEEDSVVSIDRANKVVVTENGSRYKYASLVVTSGPWTNKVLECAGLSGMPMVVSNEQTVELVPKVGSSSYDWDKFPLYTWSEAGYKGRAKDGGCIYFYTTPHVPLKTSGSSGVKIGFHRQGALLDTDDFRVTDSGRMSSTRLPHLRKELLTEQQYDLDEFAWRRVQDFVREKMPGLDPDNLAGYMRCLYQCTPDLNMIVGRHPEDPSVCFACGFSGSGFQFAPAVADMLTALVLGSKPNAMHESMAAKFDPGRFP
eukprot:TRINITY_DN56761_c0_g1_i1.p1 TRINITY_DN56761_c0_g1~~TRINITY_DN56761_c0_g1_i1.p1  ORF type:complete len:453 (-),score=48.34 TRINITY_DN56761_c0_g1_i1:146-1504(-)